MLRNTKRTIVVVTTCTLAGMVSSGCSMSGRNLLTLQKKDPPAEVLAESGPTSSFPVPPSSQVTPNAIASVAGGTAAPAASTPLPSSQPGQFAGLSASPGYSASPSPTAPNLAAAQANGLYGNAAPPKFSAFQDPIPSLAGASEIHFASLPPAFLPSTPSGLSAPAIIIPASSTRIIQTRAFIVSQLFTLSANPASQETTHPPSQRFPVTSHRANCILNIES